MVLKVVKRWWVICILMLTAFSSHATDVKDKLEQLMDYYAARDDFNGTVLIMRRGEVMLSKAYGYRNASLRTLNTENSIFQLGTNTRQFTAEAILQLDSKGKLGLDDKIEKYLPDFPNGNKISIKNLLTHTSGLYDYANDSAVLAGGPSITREEILRMIASKQPVFPAGKKFEFSSANYFLLGCIIEKITNNDYESRVRKYIVNNCFMEHSGFDYQSLDDTNKTQGYLYLVKDTGRTAPYTDSSVSYSDGAMYSTAPDLYRWYRALISYRLLPQDWQDIAYMPGKNNFALGWQIANIDGRQFFEQPGRASGFSSYEMICRKDDLFVVLLENDEQPGEAPGAIARRLVKCLYDKNFKVPAMPKSNVQSAEQLSMYTGKYTISPAYSLSIELDGPAMIARMPGREAMLMRQEAAGLFRLAGEPGAQIKFVKDKKGNVSGIVLMENGRDRKGVRI